MFLDNLSISVLQLCDYHKIGYERASERCDLSSRYFGSIARRQTAPTIVTLEKICTGFAVTPNDLLLSTSISTELSYRQSTPVTHIRCFCCTDGLTSYPVCPKCGITINREYQDFCDRCGQKLDWSELENAVVILPK